MSLDRVHLDDVPLALIESARLVDDLLWHSQLADVGGARIVEDTRPDGTTGGSLYKPSGSTAVSPVMCVDMTYPTARLWARTLAGDDDITFGVSSAATKTELKPQSVGHVKGDREGWRLSADVHIKPELAGKDEGWRKVAFVLTAGGKTGEFQLDGIYVDARMSH